MVVPPSPPLISAFKTMPVLGSLRQSVAFLSQQNAISLFWRKHAEFLSQQFYLALSLSLLSVSEELPNQAASVAPQKVQTKE